MPEEIVAIIIVSLIAGTVMVLGVAKIITGYLKSRHAGGSGPSLTSSELSGLIRSAVEEAVDPLSDRLDRLEKRLPQPVDRPLLAETSERDTEA